MKIEGDPDRIAYLVQQARNIDNAPESFKTLRDYSYKKYETYVLFKKRTLDLILKIPSYDNEIDFLGIMQYILEQKPDSIQFNNVSIQEERDLVKLTQFLNAKGYTIEKDGVTITCRRQSIL